MNITDPNFFRFARKVERLALKAGLPPRRAFAIGRQLAAGLPLAQQQRICERIGMTDDIGRRLLALMERKNTEP